MKYYNKAKKGAAYALEVRRVLVDAAVTLVAFRRKKGRSPAKMKAHYAAQLTGGAWT